MTFSPTIILDLGLMGLLVVVAIAIIRMRSLFAIVMLQGVYSLLCAAWFVSLDAVDVAFTEAAVGAGMSTVLMIGAMLLTDRESKPLPPGQRLGPLFIVIITGLALFYAIPDMPIYGDPNSAPNAYMRPIYVEATKTEIQVPNIVTAVLASYRGYDTFGETVVIFMAGIGVLLLLGLNGNAGRWRAKPDGQNIGAKPPKAVSPELATPAKPTQTRAKRKAKPKPKTSTKARTAKTKRAPVKTPRTKARAKSSTPAKKPKS